jgi:hypothetical protein
MSGFSFIRYDSYITVILDNIFTHYNSNFVQLVIIDYDTFETIVLNTYTSSQPVPSSFDFNIVNDRMYNWLVFTQEDEPEIKNELIRNILLSNNSINENNSIQQVIGTFETLKDPFEELTFTYSFVGLTGSNDHTFFDISGNQLLAKTSFDYDTKNTYTIRVRSSAINIVNQLEITERTFTILIQNINEPPTNIILSKSDITEYNGIGDIIGTFSTIDPDANNTFSYSFVGGTGSTNNVSFDISGNQLRAKEIFDYKTKSSYSIRVRSTDQGSLFTEKVFPITINERIASIVNGKISSFVLPYSSDISFNFFDTSFNTISISKIYGGNGSSLIPIIWPGIQINITKYPNNYKFIFSPYNLQTKNSIPFLSNFDFGFIFKVVDLSGNIISNINNNTVNLDIYLDKTIYNTIDSSKNKIDLYVDADLQKNAGYFLKRSSEMNNMYKFSGSLRRGNGGIGGLSGFVTPSSGSDPHITTLSGIKYDFHPSTRKNYTLYKSNEVKISSHFTGYKSGVFYDKLMIDFSNKEKIEVDFNKQKIKGKSSNISIAYETIPLKYNNHTQDKNFGKKFQPKSLTKLSILSKDPVDMYIDYQTRYVHFRFPDTFPSPEEISGLIVEPATRLD